MNVIAIGLSLFIGVLAGVAASDFNFESKNLRIEEQQSAIASLSDKQNRKDSQTEEFCKTYFINED